MIKHNHRLALVLAVGLVLCSYGLMWGLPNVFDCAQDSVVPDGALARYSSDFGRITAYRYPPFHFWLLRAAFLPLRAITGMHSGPENLKLIATAHILLARLLSVAMALGTMVFLHATARRLWDETTGRMAALVFIVSPVTLYYAKNANLDIPYVFWCAAALFLTVRLVQDNRKRDYLWLGLAASLAICTKDQAYGFILGLPVLVAMALWQRRRSAESPARARGDALCRLISAAGAFLVAFLIIHNVVFDFDGFRQHVATIIGPASQGWREFTRGPVGQARLAVETLLRLMDAWTVAGMILVIIGVAATWRERDEKRAQRLSALLPAITFHLTFLAVIGYVYARFALPLMLVFSLFAARGVLWLWTRRPAGKPLGAALAVAFVAWICAAGLSLDHVMAASGRYEAQLWLERNATAETDIAFVGSDRDMPSFNRPLDASSLASDGRYEAALAARSPDLLVLSFQPNEPVAGPRCIRLSSLLRTHMGGWGRVQTSSRPASEQDFFSLLLAGRLGYDIAARFESPLASFVPEVAESVNRTIIILERRKL